MQEFLLRVKSCRFCPPLKMSIEHHKAVVLRGAKLVLNLSIKSLALRRRWRIG
jgi:hypothetical protein